MIQPFAYTTRERAALSRLRQILNDSGFFLHATWVKMKHPCGRDSCRCGSNRRYWHLSWYVSQSRKGKPRMKSVHRKQLQQVRRWVDRYHEVKRLLTVIGDASWDRLGR
jgi:hypothetical protein